MTRTSLILASVLTLGTGLTLPSDASARRLRHRGTQLTARDRLYIDAARALYGEGLNIKRSRRITRIAPKPGGLTQQKYNRYVEVYLETLRAYLTKLDGGHWRWKKDGYGGPPRRGPRGFGRHQANRWDPRGRVKRAHLLLEPWLKYSLCRKIMAAVGDKPNIVVSWKRLSWCAWQAMQEAISPIYEYRGQPVTWDGGRDRGDLKLSQVIWRKDASGNYPIVVTVRGGTNLYTLASTNILFNLSKEVDGTFAKKLKRKADRLYKKTLAKYRRLVKSIARKQRRVARGKKVIFGKNRFYATVLQRPATGTVPCDRVFYMAWGPRRKRSEGYELGLNVNGVACGGYPLSAGEVDRNGVTNFACTRYLKPGRNKIFVGVYLSHNSFNYKRREWRYSNRRYHRKTVTYTKTRRGRKLYGSAITCTK